MNPIAKTTNSTKRRMTLQFDHEYVVPPHWRAKTKHTMDGRNRAEPMGSICCTLFTNGATEASVFDFGWDWSRNGRRQIAIAPNGRLM